MHCRPHPSLPDTTLDPEAMGHAIRAWDLGLAQEITLHDAEFGFVEGPVIRGEGVALSPDGQYLAVALLNLNEGLLVTPLPTVGAIASRSDLRLWHLEGGKELVAVSLDEQAVRANYFRGVDLAFSPDSKMLAVGGRQIRLYRVSDLAGPPH